MKKGLFLTMFLLAVPGFAQVDTVTILHLNDTHSNLAPIGPRDVALEGSIGGIARAATVIGLTRMEDPDALLLHAGDISIGDLFYTQYFAVAELQLLLALGCDAMTLGNHEFDLGPAYFEQMLDTAFAAGGFPLLSANAFMEDPAVQSLKAYVFPYIIRNAGTSTVGVFGLTTPATNMLSQPAPVVFDTNFVYTAAAMVETLSTKGCNVIICLSHLGVAYDRLLASLVPGIHLVVGGHDHYLFAEPLAAVNPLGDTTWIVQADAFYKAIGRTRLRVAGSKVTLLDYAAIPLDQSIPKEPTVTALVQGLIGGIESTYGPVFTQPVGTVSAFFDEVADSLDQPGWKDTPIGNLVANTYRAALGTQIGIQAGGSTAHPLYPGPIVAADLFRVVGYGFNTDNGLGYHLATFTIPGAALMAGLEFGVSDLETGDEFFLQVSGMTYSYDPSQPAYQRITGVTVGGQPLNLTAEYSVAANEFVPMILGAIGIPFGNLRVFAGDTTEFQILTNAVIAGGSLVPLRDGRIHVEKPNAVHDVIDNLPAAFTLDQNYPNPFNPSTVIHFSLPVDASVNVDVYDALGRTVSTLLVAMLPAGSYAVTWNGTTTSGSEAASGVYFYRMNARPANGGLPFIGMKKMLLLH